MSSYLWRAIFLVSVVFASVNSLLGQCTAKDSISGYVQDGTQAGVPADLVLPGHQPIRTDTDGHFQISCVAEGPHGITVEAPGFQDKVVFLTKKKGALLDVKIVLAVATVETSVDVSGSDPLSPMNDSVASSNLDRREIDALPDDPDQFEAQLRALASEGGGPNGVLVTVDGFQSSSTIPPKSAIDHIKINPSPFSSEYGNVYWPGGRIEIYTKPGAAAFHGSLFANDGVRALNASDPFSTAGAPAGNKRFGFALTGPIVPKASFEVALEKRNIDEQNVTYATVLGSDDAAILFQSTVAAPQRLWIGSARVDLQASKNNIATASFSSNNSSADNQGAGGLALPEAGYSLNTHQYVARFSDIEQFTPRLLQELRFGYTWNQLAQQPNSTAPALNVSGFFLGGGSANGRLIRRDDDIEVDDVLEYDRGAWTSRFGTQAFGNAVRDSVPDTFNGSYLFGGQAAPVLDGTGAPTGVQTQISALEQYRRALLGLSGGNATSYEQTTGTTSVPFYRWEQAFFVQETVKLSRRVTVQGGLRYQFQTQPETWKGWAPRAGVTWALDSQARWVVQVNSGLFVEPIPVDLARETQRLNGVRQQQTTFYSPQYGQPSAPVVPGLDVRAFDSFSSSVRQPTYVETLVGLDHTLERGWNISALADFGENWAGIRLRNVNAPVLGSQVAPVSVTAAVLSPRPFGPGRNLFQYESSGHLGGEDFDVRLAHSSKRYTLSARYIWEKITGDIDDPLVTSPQNSYSERGEKSRLASDFHQRFLLTSSFSLPFGLQLASQIDLRGGLPYNVVTGTDGNGDGDLNDRPSVVASGTANAYSTRYGVLTPDAVNGTAARNLGTMPPVFRTSVNFSRSFALAHLKSGDIPSLSANIRVSNLLNHTNVTAVDPVLGTASFDQGVAAEPGRRLEGGMRFSF